MNPATHVARLVIALSASALMTSTVAAPMAYRAHSARSEPPSIHLVGNRPATEVLPRSAVNTSATDTSAADSEGLYWSAHFPAMPAAELQGAQLSAPAYVFVDLPDVRSATFHLDGEPAGEDRSGPWELLDGHMLDPAEMTEGSHTVRVEIEFVDGSRSDLSATFTTLDR